MTSPLPGDPPARPGLYRRIHRDNPWWIPPYLLGRIPAVQPELVRMLGFVALALLFENYDFSLFNAALKYVAGDLGLAEVDLPFFSAVIRLGALPAFLLIPMADYFGRRRMFLASVCGLSIGTFCTAFSATEFQFIVCQFLSRTFMLTGSVVAIVIVSEEYPAEHRGWEPWQYSSMVILCGALGIPGNVAAGYLGDRMGRRLVGGCMLGIFPMLAWLFYNGPSIVLAFVWIVMVFALMGGNVIIRALSAELFPTEMRGTSAELMGLMEAIGAGAGLLILGSAAEPGRLIDLIPVIALSTLVAAGALILVPETSRQELEVLSRIE